MRDSLQEQGIVYVTFLDDFCMTYNGITLDDSRIKSDKITKLLSYIISHRNSNISVGELSDALWNDEESDNPANALKNLIYRTRSILKKNFGQIEFIKTGHGYYSWNKNIAVNADAWEFEALCEKAETTESAVLKTDYIKNAVKYYKKRFLEKYTDCYWIVTLNAYYHTMYINEVVGLLKLLYEQDDYKTMERVCSQALMTDDLSEDVHYYYMRALISQNRPVEAKKHFKKLEQLFKERLCVKPSDKLYSLNKDIILNHNNILHRYSRGAVVCDYDVFQKNCEIEKRRIRRNNSNAYTVVFNKASENFLYILKHSLRESDIVSAYDNTHYIILLPDCSMDNVNDIIKRILDNCSKKQEKEIPEYRLKKLVCDVEN